MRRDEPIKGIKRGGGPSSGGGAFVGVGRLEVTGDDDGGAVFEEKSLRGGMTGASIGAERS